MQRYFISNKQINNNHVTLTDNDAHHIVNVMRMKLDDQVIVVNEDEQAYLAKIEDFKNGEVYLLIQSELDNNPEMPVNVILLQGLVKADKFEFIIQKATELGIKEIYPVQMKRSIVKLDDKKSQKKLERWTKIAKEAAEQSHRNCVPKIHDVITFKQAVKIQSDYKVVAYEEEAKLNNHKMLKEVLKKMSKNDTIVVVVGPEGGIDESEIKQLKEEGFVLASFGPRILRTETASLYALSVISYELEL